jgi:hypothetical protein
LEKVEQSNIYIGLFGNEYGYVDSEGISATEREFDYAAKLNKTRLVFISGKVSKRDNREAALIKKAEQFIVRQTFASPLELKAAVYASLISYLEDQEVFVQPLSMQL